MSYASRPVSQIHATPTQLPHVPTIRLMSATPCTQNEDQANSSTSSGISDRSLAPLPLQPATRKGSSRRVLVAKKALVNEKHQLPTVKPTLGSTASHSMPRKPSIQSLQPQADICSKMLNATWNQGAPYSAPAEWATVQAPPPPRHVSNPHQYATTRRTQQPPPVALPIYSQLRTTVPEPFAIMPVKTEDGSSKAGTMRSTKVSTTSIGKSSIRSNGTVRTQDTLRVRIDDSDAPQPVLVKKKKSRLALDLSWALGDRTNITEPKDVDSPASQPNTAVPLVKEKGKLGLLKSKASSIRLSLDNGSEKENGGKDKWRWSMAIGRGKKDTTSKEAVPAKLVSKASTPAPPAILNLQTFSSSTDSAEFHYRSPSLDDFPPNVDVPPAASNPMPTKHLRSISGPLPYAHTLRADLPARTSLDPTAPEERPQPKRSFSAGGNTVLSPVQPPSSLPMSQIDDVALEHGGRKTPTFGKQTGSLAVRAMRSMRSMAKILMHPDDENTPPALSTKERSNRRSVKTRVRIPTALDFENPVARRGSNSSHESWLVQAPSSGREKSVEPVTTFATAGVSATIPGLPVAQPIVSASLRESMTTAPQIDAPRRPSGETFGTKRIPRGRASEDTHCTLSTASGYTAESSGSSESSNASHESRNRGSTGSEYEPFAESVVSSDGAKLSLASLLTSRKATMVSLTARPVDSMGKTEARRRGSLANIFDYTGGRQRPNRSSSGSKSSTTTTSSEDSPFVRDYLMQKPDMLVKPKDCHALDTIPGSPGDVMVIGALCQEDPPKLAAPMFRHTAPTPPGSELDTPAQEKKRQSEDKLMVQPRLMSDNVLSVDPLKRKAVVSLEGSDIDICLVSAATNDLGDLINRLDLSATTDCSPMKGFTPRNAGSTGLRDMEPVPPLPNSVKTRNWEPVMASNLSTAMDSDFNDTKAKKTLNTVVASTFGRRAVCPPLEEATPNCSAPTPRTTRTRRLSTPTVDGDTSYAISDDSPLKSRGKKSTGPLVFTKGSKGSTTSGLSFRRTGKESTGTMLSAFGPTAKLSTGASHSIASNAVGGVQLDPFGYEPRASPAVTKGFDDGDDSDIPDELAEILSNNSDGEVILSSKPSLCDVFIPASASALMSASELDSMLRCPVPRQAPPSLPSSPPTRAPSFPLPSQPQYAYGARSSRGSGNLQLQQGQDDLTTGSSASTSTASTGESGYGSAVVQGGFDDSSVVEMHTETPSFGEAEEEVPSSPSSSEGNHSDDTGRSDFDFTQELDRLNKGGARQSFVEQLGHVFESPADDMPFLPAEDAPPLPRFLAGRPEFAQATFPADKPSAQAVSNKRKALNMADDAKRESYRITDPDSMIYAVANMDLSRVGSTAYDGLRAPVAKKLATRPEHVRASSLSVCLDASMAELAKLNLSVMNSTKPRPHSSTDGVSRRHSRIARARISRTVRRDSTASRSSFGTSQNIGMFDPFSSNGMSSEVPLGTSAPTTDAVAMQARDQSTTPIPSVSSFGTVWNSGIDNPFGYDPSMDSRTSVYSDESKPEMFRRSSSRLSMGSDMSSFYFNSNRPTLGGQGHLQNDPTMSISPSSARPPVSFMNRARPDSIFSTTSLGHAYGNDSPPRARPAWATNRDSIISDISGRRLSRPDIGDRMFESGAALPPIAASPTNSSPGTERGGNERSFYARPSFESEASRFDDSDSLFDKFGSRPSSVSSASVFGGEEKFGMLHTQAMRQFRPLSVYSTISTVDPSDKDDGTMVTMLGGDHARVPRAALGSSFNSSPCVRAEKKRKQMFNMRQDEIVPAVQLEEQPTRPTSIEITRSPPETPALSSSSSARGSQSSIDVDRLRVLLENASLEPPSFGGGRARPRDKGRHRWSVQSRISHIESIAEEVMNENGSPQASKRDSFFAPAAPPVVIYDAEFDRDSRRNSVDWDSEFGQVLRRYHAFRTEALEAVDQSKMAWMDTEGSRFALSSFHVPYSREAIEAFLEHSQKVYIPLPLELRVRRPRSRVSSRLSPYPKGSPVKLVKGNTVTAAFTRSHKRTESSEQAYQCISPFAVGPGETAAAASVPTLATLAPLAPFSVNFQTQSANMSSAAEELLKPAPAPAGPPRPRIRPDLKRMALGWTRKQSNENDSVEYGNGKDKEPISSFNESSKPINPAHTRVNVGKENRESEAQGTLSGPNPDGSLRISRARPPKARAARAALAPSVLRI
ncbi:hypothetical protein FRB95_000227 [Tulasnella sp. JGI-2019a]|nr:hypothetical protein FRB95_000227 [Tulasnella sp. JGI-2019a]